MADDEKTIWNDAAGIGPSGTSFSTALTMSFTFVPSIAAQPKMSAKRPVAS